MAVGEARRWFDRSRSRAIAGSGRLIAPPALFLLLIVLLLFSMLIALGIGSFTIAPGDSVAILLDRAHALHTTQEILSRLNITWSANFTEQQSAVLWAIRLPRVLEAAMVGASLAIAGAALQGIFRNPLADPGVIGVSAGASLGAVLSILVGITMFGRFSTPIAAFVAGLGTAMLVYMLARFQGRTEVVTLILTGVALNSIAGALTGFMITIANDAQLRSITFWQLGSIGGATWNSVTAMAPFAIAGFILLPRWGSALNLFVLGEKEARHLGISTEQVRLGVIIVASMVTGASVAFTGTISFVGLVVPHAIRLAAGPDHRVLLPASALAGASLLVLTDLLARTVATPLEVPIGVVTALIGGPFFLFLLTRTRRQQGGWG